VNIIIGLLLPNLLCRQDGEESPMMLNRSGEEINHCDMNAVWFNNV
jgi:hypothetical protein